MLLIKHQLKLLMQATPMFESHFFFFLTADWSKWNTDLQQTRKCRCRGGFLASVWIVWWTVPPGASWLMNYTSPQKADDVKPPEVLFVMIDYPPLYLHLHSKRNPHPANPHSARPWFCDYIILGSAYFIC